jgi:hypothetical protein
VEGGGGIDSLAAEATAYLWSDSNVAGLMAFRERGGGNKTEHYRDRDREKEEKGRRKKKKKKSWSFAAVISLRSTLLQEQEPFPRQHHGRLTFTGILGAIDGCFCFLPCFP